MNQEIHQTTQINAIALDLRDRADLIAEQVHTLGYRKERIGVWVRDESYRGRAKELFRCSVCNHWQTVKRRDFAEKLRYMIYCPYCGARLHTPMEESPCEPS